MFTPMFYRSILLRQSYRDGGKVKKRTIANLSDCTPGEIVAIKLALKHKDNLTVLGSLKESVNLQEGLSIGAVWTVYQVARRLGIEKALGQALIWRKRRMHLPITGILETRGIDC
ncbi:MAG: hypothetical protein QME40_07480 [bacterium]|nr:hypothetical protein [bacterium]